MINIKSPTFSEHINEKLDVKGSVFKKVSKILHPNFIDFFQDIEGYDVSLMLIVDAQVKINSLKKAISIIEKENDVEYVSDFKSSYDNAEGESIDVTYHHFSAK